MQFANNFGNLVEDSSHDFWDVDSSKNVEGMPNFLGNSKEIDSENEGKKRMHFILKKGIFQLKSKELKGMELWSVLKENIIWTLKLQGKIAIFYKTPFSRFKELGKSVLTYLIIQYLFHYLLLTDF